MKVAIIGAGAAGCFCAVQLKSLMPEADVIIYERGQRPLAKVAITGGGRCNLTNTFQGISNLQEIYPRGWRLMQRLLRRFSPEDTCQWWEQHGVPLVVQPDQCIFPRSQSAMQIVQTLLQLMHRRNVRLRTGCRVISLSPATDICPNSSPHYTVCYESSNESSPHSEDFDAVVVTTGGSPRLAGLDFLAPLGIGIEHPVPSLFALNLGDEGLHQLSGTVVPETHISLAGTRMKANGPLLLTHFGMSGPAILRLSSYAARYLSECEYRATLSVNWMQGLNEEAIHHTLQRYMQSNRLCANLHPDHLTTRNWAYLLQRASINPEQRWDTLNNRQQNRLAALLTADLYPIQGRRQYKSEFVTCGGVALSNIDQQTLRLKAHPGIYMAGEVLDVDAITGGFNLQAAWTMGYVVAQSIHQSQA